jgi:hypothetical protein
MAASSTRFDLLEWSDISLAEQDNSAAAGGEGFLCAMLD